MSQDVVLVLISAGAGLFGAAIGLWGSLSIAREQNQVTVAMAREENQLTREQRKVERAQEIRAEVIPRLVMEFTTRIVPFKNMLDFPERHTKLAKDGFWKAAHGEGDVKQIRERLERLTKQIEELGGQFLSQIAETIKQNKILGDDLNLNGIWLPPKLLDQMYDLLYEYIARSEELEKAVLTYLEEYNEVISKHGVTREALDQLTAELSDVFERYTTRIQEIRDWFEGQRETETEHIILLARKVLGVQEADQEQG